MKGKGIWLIGGSLLILGVSLFFFFIGIIFFFLGGGSSDSFSEPADLAVIEIEGPIFESKAIIQQLEEIQKNTSIQGVILRIDSPGGGVGASQEIYQAVQRLSKDKKIIASLGGVAASGGYYIAVAAHKIVANPGTVTGSIGVLMDYINVQDLLSFAKVHAELLTAGSHKDVGSPLKPLTESDRLFLQALLDNMHQQFKKAVQDGRKLSEEKIQELGDGRVFTGEQALALGLVDQLGNQQVAIDLAKEILKLPENPKILYPKKNSPKLLDLLVTGDLENLYLNWIYSSRQGRALYLTKGIFR